jgi:dipeptidyl aminopeptidase/acylaminoacyl peptidase
MQQTLEIPNGERTLAACIHRPANSPSPLVICCHGLTGTRIGASYRMVTLARLLEAAGIATIRFDFGGCGESLGRFEDVTSQTLLDDLYTVIAFVRGRSEFDMSRIGLAGSSFGAYTASRVAPDLKGLRCSIFLAPVANPRRLTEQGMPPAAWEHLRARGWVDHHGLPLSREFIETLPTDDVPAMLASAGKPLLIFHGLHDNQVPISEGRAYEAAFKKANVPVELEAMDSSDHGLRGVDLTKEIVEKSADWLTKRLTGAD